MIVRRRTVVGIAAVLLLTGGAFTAGVVVADAGQEPRHPALLTGADWSTFGFRDKQLYLSGFIAGAAAEQVRALAARSGAASDSASISSHAIAALRDGKALDYSYAPSVYASQIDDFYWWTDHASTPIVDVMITTNRRMKQE
jgi:hypothetical protein